MRQSAQTMDLELLTKEKRIIAFISEDDSASRLIRSMTKEEMSSFCQFVPDDIICYSDLTVEQFLYGMILSSKKPEQATEEMHRLLELFQINKEEFLLDMTFQQNRLVSMIHTLMVQPEILLLEKPHDMIMDKEYQLLICEFVKLYKKGSVIRIASDCYKDIVLPCETYIFMEAGEIKAVYEQGKLPKSAKVITMQGGKLAWMDKEKMTVLWRRGNRICFLYEETNMQELTLRLCKTECADVRIEDITMEELVFENFERWMG